MMEILTKELIPHHEAVPMGFETLDGVMEFRELLDHEAVPMGFETISVTVNLGVGDTIMKQSLWDLKLS